MPAIPPFETAIEGSELTDHIAHMTCPDLSSSKSQEVTMATYTLKVSVDPSHIPQFQKNGFRLCAANGVNSFDKLNFNTIAASSGQ